MKVYLASYSVDNSVNCVAASLLQSLILDFNFQVATNFDASVRVASNVSIGRPRLDGLGFVTRNLEASDELVIIDDNTPSGLSHHGPQVLENLAHIATRIPVVILSHQDSSNFITYPKPFQFVYTAHASTHFKKDTRYKPLPIGLTNELISESTVHLSSRSLKLRNGIISNFGRTLSQGVRQALTLALMPNLSKHFSISEVASTGDGYIQDLLAHEAILAYGGDFIWPLQQNAYSS